MNVLILHQHFKTPAGGGALRSYYLAQALVRHGIKTTVVTAHNEKDYRRENVDGADVHYLPVLYDNRFGFMARTVSFLKFAWKSARLARTFQRVDLCYAISVPLTIGLSAIWLKKSQKIPFVFEVGDLWPDAPIQMGFVRNHFLQGLLYAMERRIYREARSIVALSTSMKAAIEGKIKGKVIDVIPNMADCNFLRPGMKDPQLEKKFGVEGKWVVSYIGALGVANGLDYYLDAASASGQAGLPIQFLLCGQGAEADRLEMSASQRKLENVSFIDFQNREGVSEVLNVTDAVFVSYRNVPVLGTGSPNKYFDGLAAGKLIVVNFAGWIKDEIEENRCGIGVDPNRPEDFVTQIRPFLNREMLNRFQQAARELGERKYERTTLSARFAEILTGR